MTSWDLYALYNSFCYPTFFFMYTSNILAKVSFIICHSGLLVDISDSSSCSSNLVGARVVMNDFTTWTSIGDDPALQYIDFGLRTSSFLSSTSFSLVATYVVFASCPIITMEFALKESSKKPRMYFLALHLLALCGMHQIFERPSLRSPFLMQYPYAPKISFIRSWCKSKHLEPQYLHKQVPIKTWVYVVGLKPLTQGSLNNGKSQYD